jgi:hypothetical protein
MSTKYKQEKASSTVARVLRPRQQRVPEEQLKAERVQLVADPFSERLTTECVQRMTITLRARNGSGLAEACLDFAQALG